MSRARTLVYDINGRHHALALCCFMAGVSAHVAEHVAQAIEIYGLGYAVNDSRGIAGQWIPWLATSEWLHYWFALFTLVGLVLLLPAFQGTARFWWTFAAAMEFWHHFEHVLLLYQRVSGNFFFGQPVPTGFGQLIMPRVELHLLYNSLVFAPMVIALYEHFLSGQAASYGVSICGCAERMRRRAMARATTT